MSTATESDDRSAKRPAIAAILAVIIPGLGHVYLRSWVRAILWFALYFSATQWFVPSEAYPDAVSLDAIIAATGVVPIHVAFLIFSIAMLNVLDAYLVALRRSRSNRAGDGPVATCPNCRRDLDADLDFCHWCTTELE